jgi:hypothetical protein
VVCITRLQNGRTFETAYWKITITKVYTDNCKITLFNKANNMKYIYYSNDLDIYVQDPSENFVRAITSGQQHNLGINHNIPLPIMVVND